MLPALNECLILYLINGSLGFIFIWQLANSLKFNYALLLAAGSIMLWLSYTVAVYDKLTIMQPDILWINIFIFMGLISYVYYRTVIARSKIAASIAMISITVFLWLAIAINPLGVSLILLITILELTLFYTYLSTIYWRFWLIICALSLIWLILSPLLALLLLSTLTLIESLIWLYFARRPSYSNYFRWLFYTPLILILLYFNLELAAWLNLMLIIPLLSLGLWLHNPILLFALAWFVALNLLDLGLAEVAMGYNYISSLGIILALIYYFIYHLKQLNLSYKIVIISLGVFQSQFWLQDDSSAKFQAAQLAIQNQQPLLAQQYYHYVLRHIPENTATYLHLLRLSCQYPQQIISPSIKHEILPQLANKIIGSDGIQALIELLPLIADCELIHAEEMQNLLQLLYHNAPNYHKLKLSYLQALFSVARSLAESKPTLAQEYLDLATLNLPKRHIFMAEFDYWQRQINLFSQQ